MRTPRISTNSTSIWYNFIKMALGLMLLVIIGYVVIIGVIALIATEINFSDLIVNAGIEIKHIIQRISEAE